MDGFCLAARVEFLPRAAQGVRIDIGPERRQQFVEAQAPATFCPFEKSLVIDTANMRFSPAPADRIGQPAGHCAAQQELEPAVPRELVVRQLRAEIDDPLVGIGIARLDPDGRREAPVALPARRQVRADLPDPIEPGVVRLEARKRLPHALETRS